jgi:hypothetical protein
MAEKSGSDFTHGIGKLVGWHMRHSSFEYDIWRFNGKHPVSLRPSFVPIFCWPVEIKCCMELNTYEVMLNQQ